MDNKNNRKEALKQQNKAHEIERIRILNGYKWVTNDVEHKLVSPKKLKHFLFKGFRLVNSNHLNS